MNTKTGAIILVAVCAGLIIALFATKKYGDAELNKKTDAILVFSNQLTLATANLDDLRQVNLTLTNDLAASQQQILALSNSFAEASNTLTDTKSSLQSAQNQVTNLNERLTDLQSQNQVLDERANSLSNVIANLDMHIAETQQKLAHSETNNSFLAEQLKEQLAQRAELERRFNDINEMRSQVRKLRDELFTARRLQWMREGTDPMTQARGAQLLMQHPAATTSTNAPAGTDKNNSLFDLNVEIGSDGSVKVSPATTNTPAH